MTMKKTIQDKILDAYVDAVDLPTIPSSNRHCSDLSGSALVEYLQSLKDGERVQETTPSAFYGMHGDVYRNKEGSVCVLWDAFPNETGRTGTSVTGGTRRVSDLPN